MSNVAEFIETRKSVEALVKQVVLTVQNKTVHESKKHLNEANRQLETLKTMVDNDVQVIVVNRLTRQLTSLGTKVEGMIAKLPKGKSPRKKRPEAEKLNVPVRPESGEAPEIVVFERP
jgi:hypothetical protein